MHRWFAALIVLAVAGPTGCAPVRYHRPNVAVNSVNALTLRNSKAEVLDHLLKATAQSPFTLSTVDREAGTAVLHYRGDPAEYVDCGKYYEGGIDRFQTVAVSDLTYYDRTGQIHQTLLLEGEIRLKANEIAPQRTTVEIDVVYALEKDSRSRDSISGKEEASRKESIRFHSNRSGFFGPPLHEQCRPSGRMEKSVLDLFRN
jgi:hypothetical protein